MKRTLGTVGMVLVAIASLGLGRAACASETSCIVGERNYPGVRIGFGPRCTTEIGVSEACYLAHGWHLLPSCFAGLDEDGTCALANEHTQFRLFVNGALVPVSYINIYVDTDDEFPGYWRRRSVYEFPAGYFAAGVHLFTAVWNYDFSGMCEACFTPDTLDQCMGDLTLEFMLSVVHR
jgi:hypothetical protein